MTDTERLRETIEAIDKMRAGGGMPAAHEFTTAIADAQLDQILGAARLVLAAQGGTGQTGVVTEEMLDAAMAQFGSGKGVRDGIYRVLNFALAARPAPTREEIAQIIRDAVLRLAARNPAYDEPGDEPCELLGADAILALMQRGGQP